jgi:hypothetical protein
MKDQSKTKQVLIQEEVSLRQRIAEPEKSESERKRLEEEMTSRNISSRTNSRYLSAVEGQEAWGFKRDARENKLMPRAMKRNVPA